MYLLGESKKELIAVIFHHVDEEAQEFLNAHPATTAEIQHLCSDLQVLGRSEFKQILKWRLTVKKGLENLLKEKGQQDSSSEEEEKETKSEQEDENSEDELMNEMEDIKKKLERKQKREKKKRKEQKMNARIRSAQLAQAEGIGEEVMTGPESLFTLTGIKTTKISDVDVPDSEAEESESEQDRDSDDSSDSDLDEQRRKYDEQMDRHLEKSYQDWKIRQRMTQGGALKKKRKRLGMDGELESSGDDDEEDRPVDEKESSHDTEQDVSSDEGDLLVDLDTEKQKIKPVDAWFSQDIFNGEVEEESTDSESGPSLQGNGNVVSESSEEEQIEPSIPQEPGKNTDFEIVPLSGDESDSAAEEFEDMDDEAKAEVLALAKKFIRKKSKGELIEAAYNRYALYVKSILPCVN